MCQLPHATVRTGRLVGFAALTWLALCPAVHKFGSSKACVCMIPNLTSKQYFHFVKHLVISQRTVSTAGNNSCGQGNLRGRLFSFQHPIFPYLSPLKAELQTSANPYSVFHRFPPSGTVPVMDVQGLCGENDLSV